ncbi:hypothetical protein ACFL6U_33065 [Planctomycetota bacterium]
MKTNHFIIVLVLCMSYSSSIYAAAERSNYLETGGQRKLEVLYKKAGGQDLHLDLYYPTTNRAEKSPVIVFTHGGGWAAGSRHKVANGAFGLVFQQLVKEGFAVAPVEIMIVKNSGHNWRKVGADIEPPREVIIERTVQFFVDHF